MQNFDVWLNSVLRGIVAVINSDDVQKTSGGFALSRALYSGIHLHGMGDLDIDPELPHSLVDGLSLEPSTFSESGWIVSSDLGTDLLLKRRNIDIRVPKDHESLIYSSTHSKAMIKRDRRVLAVMPGWDRIVSAHGWPSPGDARIYLPTVSNPRAVAALVSTLDNLIFPWHIKTTRRETASRPDSVVLYIRSTDIDDVVNVVRDVVPKGGPTTRIPGFSTPCGDMWTIGLGLVRPESQEVSYGWSFARDLTKKLMQESNRSLTAEEQARSALQEFLQDSAEGKSDVKVSR